MGERDDELERLIEAEIRESWRYAPYPHEKIRPRLRDRLPDAWVFWSVVAVLTVMALLVAIEMFTNIDLGLVPNGP